MQTPRTIAIASGKGGVGKTWFAITLAHALARQGRRTLLVDGDLGLANVDVQLGLLPGKGLPDLLTGTPLEAAVHRHGPGGFDVLAGSSGTGALASLDPSGVERLLALLAAATGYAHIVLDLGAGLDGSVRRMSAWADALIVVATEDPASITDAYATIKLHAASHPGGDTRLVINAAPSQAAAERTAATIRRACGAFLGMEPGWLGGIRRDPAVPDAVRRQSLLLARAPQSNAAADILRIAASL